MKNQDLYKSAMDKITPSPEWEADTLKKLAEARKEMSSAAPSSKSKAVWFKKSTALPLAAAAAVALLAIPAAQLLPDTKEAAFDKNQAMLAAEGPLMNDSAQPPHTVSETPFGLRSAQPNPELEIGESISIASDHPDPCPETSVAPSTFNTELPKVSFYKDPSRSVGHERLYSQLGELNDLNPTWNLPANQMPKELPVWFLPEGEKHISMFQSQMQRAADVLGLTLLMDDPQPCPADYPQPELWPQSLTGRLLDADGNIVCELESVQNALISSTPDKNVTDSSSPDLLRQAVYQALGSLTSLLNTDTLTYSQDASGNPFWFDPGLADDSITQKLLDFTFHRIEVSVSENGDISHMRLHLAPTSALRGIYPIKSLDEATAELQTLLRSLPERSSLIGSDTDATVSPAPGDIVGWRIEYQQNALSADLVPVYEFLVKLPDETAQKEQQRTQNDPNASMSDDVHRVRSYFVSAISNEYRK